MDSITHIVLGATIGEAIAGKKLGKSALLWGAFAQSLPDIDFIGSFWMGTAQDVWAHRSITHSFLFVLVMALVLAAVAGRRLSFREWAVFFGVQLFVHIFIDAFNAYGTGWFEPFSHYRVSFHALFVADPFYSIWLLVAAVALWILRRGHPLRKFWVWFGLGLSCCYVLYCLYNKGQADERVSKELQRQGIRATRWFTTPAPLNSWLWYTVAEDSGGYRTAYLSVFDRQPALDFHFFPRNDSLLASYRQRTDVQYLLRFSQGYYTMENWQDTVVFNVLRFGQIKGWAEENPRFVFHYFLQYPGENGIIMQRGRVSGWDRRAIHAYLQRIAGN